MTRKQFRVLAVAAIVTAACPARAAEPGGRCVRFITEGATLHLSVANGTNISGLTPVDICGLNPGVRYALSVGGAGFERRVGTFSITDDGRVRAGGRRIAATLRNAVLPGWGTGATGHGTAAFADFLSIAAAGYVLFAEHEELGHLENRLAVIDGAIADFPARADALGGPRLIAAADVDTQRSHRDRLFGLAAAIYAHQLIDPFLLSPPPRIESVETGNGTTALVGSRRNSRGKAFIHSLLRPGRGQCYQGKKTRGFLFEAGSLVAAILFLEHDARIDFETARVDDATRRLSRAQDDESRRILEAEAAGYRDDADEARFRRDIAGGALIGLWGLSLLDSLFPGDGGDAPQWSLRPRRGGIAICLKF